MQQANISNQNQDESFPELIDLQNLKERFVCCFKKPAYLVCISSKCLYSGLICQEINCQCFQFHKQCSYITLQSMFTGIKQHQVQRKQGKKLYQAIKAKINSFIDQLSQLREKMDRKQEFYGFNQNQIQLIVLANQNKIQNINGKLANSIKRNFKQKQFKEIPLQSQFKHQIEIRENLFKGFYQSFKVFTQADNFSFNKHLYKYPLDVQSLLKNAKKVSITPKKEVNDIWMKINYKYHQYIFSNQQLPMKNQSENFYFSILINEIKNGNQFGIGIVYQDQLLSNLWRHIGYQLCDKKIIKNNERIYQNPYFNDFIKKTPSQIVCYVDTKKKNISIIYSSQVQMKIQFKQIYKESKFYAFVTVGGGKIKFL